MNNQVQTIQETRNESLLSFYQILRTPMGVDWPFARLFTKNSNFVIKFDFIYYAYILLNLYVYVSFPKKELHLTSQTF